MKDLGYQNAWPGHYVDANGNETTQANATSWKQINPTEYNACRELKHDLICIDTVYGDHQRECPICQIKWGWDSGD